MMFSKISMQGFLVVLNLLAGGLLSSAPSSAAVILTDDAGFGEDSIIRDVDNVRDFLRLDFTTPFTYSEVITQFGVGGTFEGWRVASQTELEDLGAAAGILHTSTDPTMIARATELRDWFCVDCVNSTSTHVYARGLLIDQIIETIEGVDEVVQLAFSIGECIICDPDEADFRISGFGRHIWRNEEVFLVRAADSAISEPTSLALMGLALAGFGYRRYRS